MIGAVDWPAEPARTIVLGAGGGFDVLAAAVVADAIEARVPQARIDIAGLLNPKFEHYYPGPAGVRAEQAVNDAEGCVRFRRADLEEPPQSLAERQASGAPKPIVDPLLAHVTGRSIRQLSTRFGLEEPAQLLAAYDRVVLCDVGGDILYHGGRDNAARTPLMDAFALAACRRAAELRPDAERCVVLLGLGTDGELSAGSIRQTVEAFERSDAVICEGRSSAADFERLQGLLDAVGIAGGTTLRLIRASRDALTRGARLPIMRGRDMEPFRGWVDRVLVVHAAAVIAHNPLAQGEDMAEIGRLAHGLGWRRPAPRSASR